MLRHEDEGGLSISFLGVFFPTPPLLITHFYDVIEELSSSSVSLDACVAAASILNYIIS